MNFCGIRVYGYQTGVIISDKIPKAIAIDTANDNKPLIVTTTGRVFKYNTGTLNLLSSWTERAGTTAIDVASGTYDWIIKKDDLKSYQWNTSNSSFEVKS